MSVGAEREAFDAVRFAKPYATAIKAHNRNFPVNAAKWLSERRFDEIERILIAKAQQVDRRTSLCSSCAELDLPWKSGELF